jgi:chromosome segregation ATPase
MEKVQQTYPGSDFEQFWAGLERTRALVEEIARQQEETARQMKENAKEAARQQEETARQMKENAKEVARRQEEAARQMKENVKEAAKETERAHNEAERVHKEMERAIREVAEEHKETERVVKEVGKQLGELKNSFGQVVEHMVVPNLVEKFRELGFDFGKAGSNIKFKDRKHDIFTEVDAFLEDGDKVMAVETKVRPTLDDVAYHVERMEKLRRYADLRGDDRKYLGAIAGVVIHETVRECILANGFYVVEPSGDTFNITAPEGKYRPREW